MKIDFLNKEFLKILPEELKYELKKIDKIQGIYFAIKSASSEESFLVCVLLMDGIYDDEFRSELIKRVLSIMDKKVKFELPIDGVILNDSRILFSAATANGVNYLVDPE